MASTDLSKKWQFLLVKKILVPVIAIMVITALICAVKRQLNSLFVFNVLFILGILYLALAALPSTLSSSIKGGFWFWVKSLNPNNSASAQIGREYSFFDSTVKVIIIRIMVLGIVWAIGHLIYKFRLLG